MKFIFFFLLISFCFLLIAPTSYAGTPLFHLVKGNKQDVLILGEVVSEMEDSRNVKIIFVFPQNKINSLQKNNQIKINNIAKIINFSEAEEKAITIGKKYLMSLNKNDNFYIPAWGFYEFTGTNYSNAKLVRNESSKYEATNNEMLQIFINSGGAKKDFSIDCSGLFYCILTNKQTGEKITVEKAIRKKNILLCGIGIGIGVLILVGSIIFISRKKK